MSINLVDIIFGIISYEFLILFLSAYIMSIFWGFHDAKKRDKPPLLVGLMIALFIWPVGLLVWLIFRPKKT